MTKHSKTLWTTALALGLLLDLLFWKQSPGINFTLYSLTCVAAGFFLLRVNRQRAAGKTYWLLPLIAAFAAIVCIRAEPLTVLMTAAFTLFLMVVLSNTFLGGRWLNYGIADYVAAFFSVAVSAVSRPMSFSAEVRKERVGSGEAHSRPKIWPYLRGLVFAIPIVAVFASLLASADPVFSGELSELLGFFSIENLPQYLFRLAYILIAGYLLLGVILHASAKSQDEKLIGEEKPLLAPFLGFTEAMIVLGSVAILFAAFVVVQFQYFFGGQANITTAGYTYAEYARRGFGELVTVAFFSLLLIAGLGNITQKEGRAERWWFSAVSILIVLLVGIMLVSAYQRLVLYEEAYGFSRLRTYTHAALIWVGLLLSAVVALQILQRDRYLAAAALTAALGFAITLAFVNVDGLIVRENVQRANERKELDVPYLVSLSTDSVPALAEAYESPSTGRETRDATGAALLCRSKMAPRTGDGDWRSFTFSKWQADMALQRVQNELAGYRVIDETWPVRISSPLGTTYECYGKVLD